MEREFKWNASDSAAFDRLLINDCISPYIESSYFISMQAIYYDSADHMVSKLRGGLRLRRENGKGVVCLKLTSHSAGALQQREEYECQADDIRSGLRALPAEGAPLDLCDALLEADLIEQGRTEFIRRAYLLRVGRCTCELSLDTGKIIRQGRSLPICEIELEHKSGDVEEFDDFAVHLEQQFALEPQPLSKLMRMKQL